jgi:PhnB protein
MTDATITPYLFFGGQCEEALKYYKGALGAEITMAMRFDESPDPPPPGVLKPGFERKIMHSSFRIHGAEIMASDGCGDTDKFSGFQLSLAVATESHARQVFDNLARDGQVRMPLSKTFWSPCFGMVTDQFGVGWMITVQPS